MEDNRTMRLGLYRKIEVARKQLPYMDEDAFRGLLRSEFGVESRKDMSVSQLSRLAHHFARLGVEYKAPSKIPRKGDAVSVSGQSPQRLRSRNSRPDWVEITDFMFYAREKRQILAIWRKLGYSMTSLDTRVKRAFGARCFLWLQDGEKISILLSD